jgi:CubicO group peptidase (beta-lactamase class C family)/pimeloyl-ACP methyl ester carboxylesterase
MLSRYSPVTRLVNRQASLLALAAVCSLASPVASHGQSLDAAVTAEHARLKAPAVSVAVMEKGRIVYANAFGSADLENRVSATPETRFRTASIAKTLTATAVLQLYEKGAIDLDAPIQHYCAAFPQTPWPVTARQLLGHLAGVRHYAKPGESTGTQHYFTVTESLKAFAGDPLLFEPGTKYSYTTYGFSVLGCAIEGVAKTTFGEYMRSRVFEPAGMTHTSVDDVYLLIPNRARGYFLLDQASFDQLPAAGKAIAAVGGVYNAPLHDTSMKIPGGGLLSTPTDLMKFAAALFDGKLLKPETLKLMWTSQKTADGKPTEYGYGWGIGSNPGRLIVSHGGNQAGASSTFMVDVTNQLALAVMTNLEDADLSGIRRVLIGPLSPAGKYTTPAAPVAPASLAQSGEPYSLQTPKGAEAATIYRIEVPENRAKPQGPRIMLAVVRLAAVSSPSRPPVIYLAGGPGDSGINAAQISATYDVLQRIRRYADVILLDQRGTGQSVPRPNCGATAPLPADFFVSAVTMQRALEPAVTSCRDEWRRRGVDLAAYNTEASADDVADVAKALNARRVSLFGFSYGTHLAASVVRRHPALVDRVVFAGFEGPDDNEKLPSVYDRQVAKISALAAAQPHIAALMPDFEAALRAVLSRAEQRPFEVEVPVPGGPARTLRVGREGLLYVLRRDIGDTNDLPVFPKLIWQLSKDETALLTPYVQRRFQQLGRGVALMNFAMDCASGAPPSRRAAIRTELPRSIFGVMTNPLSGVCDVLGIPELSDAYRAPLSTDVPSLFVSGTLDSNTPPEQADRGRREFSRSSHLVVTDAGHESTLIPEVAEGIAEFLRGADVPSRTIAGPRLRFESLR